ncbi:energy transducer TonB [Aequorivita sp. SDUM287046]|uniref:Energy transducer TonB n=1 Tax=Aequorivita aurantiaca TaxID=3053356 RepID=A0ABT8DIH9_9FLAO|nr:energy transducer TonB [Aequorivita aurantiaca]MDN3724722.1 energy transducer TonB [Aequorivita aurantiaca]
MFKNLYLVCLIFCSTFVIAQVEETVTDVSESEMGKTDVPFATIENVPVYPGCKGNGNVELKSCMSSKISEFINIHFDMKKIASLDLPPKIYRTAVQFKIDKNGDVVDVRARAENEEIEKEAVRVVSNLPQMKPGMQKGEAVGVLYSLPIIFKVEPPTETNKKKKKRKTKN